MTQPDNVDVLEEFVEGLEESGKSGSLSSYDDLK